MAQAELLKRQEELERKAAELDRREREMQNLSQHGVVSKMFEIKITFKHFKLCLDWLWVI